MSTDDPSADHWPPLSEHVRNAARDELHVIRVSLRAARHDAATDWNDLTADEVARANRFVVEPPRRRFRLCRRAVRRCLGWFTNSDPAAIRFDSERNGKPRLLAPAETGLTFNVSHSGDWGVIAIGWNCQLGVDIETMDPSLNTSALADRFFSVDEQRELNALPPEDQRPGFYRLWTSKEAYMKALGLGMLLPLGSFTMCANPHWPPRLISGDDREGPWQMAAFSVSDTVPGVLMWNGEARTVHCWSAPEDW